MSHNQTLLRASTNLELSLRLTTDAQFRKAAIRTFTKGTINERRIEPDSPGWAEPPPQHRGGTSKREERRQAGPPATLKGNIDNAIDTIDDTRNRQQALSYPIRLLKKRYGLSRNYAALIAAEFRWGDAR